MLVSGRVGVLRCQYGTTKIHLPSQTFTTDKKSWNKWDGWNKATFYVILIESAILLMAEILHQLICSLSHYLQGFIHPSWCRISSINSSMSISLSLRSTADSGHELGDTVKKAWTLKPFWEDDLGVGITTFQSFQQAEVELASANILPHEMDMPTRKQR